MQMTQVGSVLGAPEVMQMIFGYEYEFAGTTIREVVEVLPLSSITNDNARGNNSRQFATAAGAGQLRMSLTRRLSFFSQYVYYHHAIADGAFLLERFPVGLDRQDVRAGLSLSVPLLK